MLPLYKCPPEASLAASVFPGDGPMSRLMRAFNWRRTPLGPVERWPQSLKTSVSICLASRFPIVLYWGPEYVVLYNDAYSQILGAKHPWALGQTCRACWAEIWDTIGPMLDGVFKTGKATWSDDLLLLLRRFGYPEECYFSFSFSPVQVESGRVGGIFTAVIETTDKVVGERRLRTLRDLAAGAVAAENEQDAWRIAASTLAENNKDAPFSILCRVVDGTLRVERAAGIDPRHSLCLELCETGSELFRKAMEVARSGRLAELKDLALGIGHLPSEPWGAAPHTGLLLPIAALGQGPSGALLAAVSPAKALDEGYRTFFDLLARQISTNIAVARSHEEARQRAESLANLDRAKTLFFSNISHELRTPLTLLLGPTEAALSSPEGALKGENLEMVHRNELRLLKLVNTLLDFSRIEAGRVQATFQPTDLPGLTADIAGAFRSAMEEAGLKFSVLCEPMDEPIHVDREMWEKIVLNLLSNAFKFTFEGRVELMLKRGEGGIELCVRDTGIGIPPHELPHIFERFHRVENTRARTYEGTGIGLALVRELVKLHGGSVHVESAPGAGSSFHIAMPAGTAHLPADRIQAAEARTSRGISAQAYIEEATGWLSGTSIDLPSGLAGLEDVALAAPSPGLADAPPANPPDWIIVADDNADMRHYLARLLRDHYRVHTVSDGVEAVKAAQRLRPALVLTDIMMPGLDGFGVLRAIHGDESLRGTPVILLSARAGEESRLEGLRGGADDYLVKPFTARVLVARVATHVNMARLRREAEEREARLHAEADMERTNLRRNQELLDIALEASGTGTFRWNPHTGEFLEFGKNLRKLVGLAPHETVRITEDFAARVHSDDLPRLISAVNACRTGSDFEMEFRVVPAGGGLRWLYGRAKMQWEDGRPMHLVGACADITNRKRAEQALRESEERLRLAQQAANIGTFELNLQNGVNRWTPELEAMHGLAPGTFEGTQKHWTRLLHPGDRPAVLRQVQASLQSGDPVQEEWRVIWPDGSIHWILGRWQVFKDESGKPERVAGINVDVTERKAAEEARRRLSAIVESSDDAIISKDLNGIVASWNPRAERLFGYSEREMIGQSILTIIPPELHGDEDMILGKIRSGQKIDHFETIRVAKSGERIEISLSISPVRDERGNIVGAAKIARDIRESKQIERTLRTTEKLAAAGRLAATVAHEINNPLEAVTNLVYLAQRDLPPDADKAAAHMASAKRELDRVAHIARQTLGFYRDTSSPIRFNVAQTLDDLLALYERRLETRNIRVGRRYDHGTELVALAGEIRQALSNLLSNAMDAMPGGGALMVRVRKTREWRNSHAAGVRVTIADSGGGIAPEHQRSLFQPFFTTKVNVGTGLGLWITRGIVEKHGGTIRVKSRTGANHGTAFSIFLPFREDRLPGSSNGWRTAGKNEEMPKASANEPVG